MIDVKLYDGNLSSPTLDLDLTGRVQKLRFSTRIPGGFFMASFDLRVDLPGGWEWLRDKIFYRLLISDVNDVLFEGRLEDPVLSKGAVGATFFGYYGNLSDLVWNGSFSANADATIKSILTSHCVQINSDQTNIAATNISISSQDGDQDIYPMKIFERLLNFSDSTKGIWDLAIWDDRIPYLIKRDASTVTWNVRLADLDKYRIKYTGNEIRNQVYTVYQSGGNKTRTADADDSASQTKYGFVRSHAIPDLDAVSATAAQGQRDGYLEAHKDAWPQLDNITIGPWVFNSNQRKTPSYKVRAGDVIRVQDLIPQTGDLDTITQDALRTFFIVETEYSVDSGTLRLTLDRASDNLDAVLARSL